MALIMKVNITELANEFGAKGKIHRTEKNKKAVEL